MRAMRRGELQQFSVHNVPTTDHSLHVQQLPHTAPDPRQQKETGRKRPTRRHARDYHLQRRRVPRCTIYHVPTTVRPTRCTYRMPEPAKMPAVNCRGAEKPVPEKRKNITKYIKIDKDPKYRQRATCPALARADRYAARAAARR